MVEGRFCQNCGQENIVTQQNIWSLTKHFIFDIFHFDGKFFDTLRFLLFKPGFVAKEYVSGKRLSYLDPIRMYLFTSAVFFLIFFSFNNLKINTSDDFVDKLSVNERMKVAFDLNAQIKDSQRVKVNQKAMIYLLDSTQSIYLQKVDSLNDSSILYKGQPRQIIPKLDSLKMYPDSVTKETSWLEKQWLNKKRNKVDTEYGGDMKSAMISLFQSFIHRLPYLLFISLPFFALILKLLYNRRKEFYYSDHSVFTLYHYIFSFILILVLFGFSALKERLNWSIFNWIIFILFLSWFFHLYKGMLKFYGQSRFKTIGKFILLNILGLLILLFLFIIFFALTAYQF
jgi:hypothetical protein